MGPDQGKPGTTEDVLLPRLNDARGHAANILAPGGTIWRLDHEGKNMSLVAAGFRNHFDAAFSPTGELFTFDSDMEWDEALPWYRHGARLPLPAGVRLRLAHRGGQHAGLLHRQPAAARRDRPRLAGRRRVLRSPRLPRRSTAAPSSWPTGRSASSAPSIWSATGPATRRKAEQFCTGAPMNVTDLAVGPDGALYFTMGGRGTQGGVYRIMFPSAPSRRTETEHQVLTGVPVQRHNPCRRGAGPAGPGLGREPSAIKTEQLAGCIAHRFIGPTDTAERLHCPDDAPNQNSPSRPRRFFGTLPQDKDPEVRAHAVWLLGVNALPRKARRPLIRPSRTRTPWSAAAPARR